MLGRSRSIISRTLTESVRNSSKTTLGFRNRLAPSLASVKSATPLATRPLHAASGAAIAAEDVAARQSRSWLGAACTVVAAALGFAATRSASAEEKVVAPKVLVSKDEIVEDAVLTFAPNVPPPINRKHPVTLRVVLRTEVVEAPLTNKYKYVFWTFNGKVPGPMIRARVGDTLEITHENLDQSGMPHNIDFHAASGPGGGAPLLFAEMNEKRTARLKLLNPGLYIYHCAAAPVPAHIANGMYGLVLVEPEEGLPKVDKEFYVLQSEFYVEPPDSSKSNLVEECNYAAGLMEEPEVVVFNGREGSLTQGEVLKANTNDKIRIYFGNAGPNLISSFHVIGAIFDKVYRDADLLSPPARNLQIALTPPGGASVVEFSCPVPGTHTLVDHSIFRLDKGCVGFLSISGDPNPKVYASSEPPKNCPGCKLHA